MVHTPWIVAFLVGLAVFQVSSGKRNYMLDESTYLTLVHDDPDVVQDNVGRPGRASSTHSCNSIRAVPQALRSASHMRPRGLDYFYQKYTEAYGIPILGSRTLSDDAMKRACYVVRFIFADRYDIRNAYYNNYGRFALMAVSEVTTHIPEHRFLGSWWNTRARGLGATPQAPVSTGGEENALCLQNDRYRVEDIILHEFVHGVHLLGANFAIRGFDSRLRGLYNHARASGKWANTYSLSTDREYFAEGVQSYFDTNPYTNPPNGIHNHVNTRARLRSYDPNLYNLIREIFPCGNEYIKRCRRDRSAEMAQRLRMNCDGNGGDSGEEGGSDSGEEGGGDSGEEGGCVDNNVSCARWAGRGECSKNPGYMRVNCKKSCNVCNDGGQGCQDRNSQCAQWAGRGECRANPKYMLVFCKRSCDSC